MTRLPMLIALLALGLSAQAQVYKWVDKDGKVIYSDKPPTSEQAKQLKVAPPPPAAASTKSAVEKDKDLEKGRKEVLEKAKSSEESARRASAAEENCARARAYLQTVTDGGRIARTNEKGERIILDDEQIAAEKIRAEKSVAELCKKP